MQILPFRWYLPAHSTSAAASTAQMSVETNCTLHLTVTQLHWHLHSSQQAWPYAYFDVLISNNSIKSTSNKPTAIERATPVERKGLFPWVTGHGSLCSSPSRSVKFISILCTGCRNLQKCTHSVFLLLSSDKKKHVSLFLTHINITETVIRSEETRSTLSSYIQTF